MVVVGGGPLRFYTKEECETWLSDRQRKKPDVVPEVRVERIEYPSQPYRVFFFAHWIASQLTYRRPTLLFITEWGIWPKKRLSRAVGLQGFKRTRSRQIEWRVVFFK
jgi:hypothetical protein